MKETNEILRKPTLTPGEVEKQATYLRTTSEIALPSFDPSSSGGEKKEETHHAPPYSTMLHHAPPNCKYFFTYVCTTAVVICRSSSPSGHLDNSRAIAKRKILPTTRPAFARRQPGVPGASASRPPRAAPRPRPPKRRRRLPPGGVRSFVDLMSCSFIG